MYLAGASIGFSTPITPEQSFMQDISENSYLWHFSGCSLLSISEASQARERIALSTPAHYRLAKMRNAVEITRIFRNFWCQPMINLRCSGVFVHSIESSISRLATGFSGSCRPPSAPIPQERAIENFLCLPLSLGWEAFSDCSIKGVIPAGVSELEKLFLGTSLMKIT